MWIFRKNKNSWYYDIHVNDSDLFTSVRIKLSNGNINNTNFSLIKKCKKIWGWNFVSQILKNRFY